MTWAVSAKLIAYSSGNTTAWAWRNCSTVRAEAMASRAFINTASSPLAGRDMNFSIKVDGGSLLHQ
jgi:hypothetical protein